VLPAAPRSAAPDAKATPTPEPFRFDYLRIRDRIEASGETSRSIEASVLLRTPEAVQQFGQTGAIYVAGFGTVEFESVRIQKPSGVWNDVKDGQVEDLNPFGTAEAPIVADLRFKRLTILGIEPGDRLSYTLVASQKPFVAGQAYGEMKFSHVPMDGPQVYELDVPLAMKLRVNVRSGFGAAWEVGSGPANRLVRRLQAIIPPADVPGVGLTEAQTQLLHLPDVSFTTFPSWSKVGQWWWEMSRSQVASDATIQREAERVTAASKTPREKVHALGSFVSTNILHVNVSFAKGRMQPRPAALVLSSRYGDGKDKVGLLMALSSAVGLEVRPAFLHTQRNELQEDTPGPQQFDHVIAVAVLGPTEKDGLWIDATNAFTSPLSLMPALRDKRALAIDRTGMGFLVRTPALPPQPSRRSVTLTGTIETSGRFKGRVRIEDRSDNEPGLRASFAAAPPARHAEMIRTSLGRTWSLAKITSVSIASPTDLAAPFWLEFDFERGVPGIEAEKEWKFWIPDLGPVLQEGAIDATANRPVAFDVGEVAFEASVDIPENLIARPPAAVTLNRPFATLVSSYTVSGRTLAVNRVMRLIAPSISAEQLLDYETFRNAAATDRAEDFVLGPMKITPPAR